MVFNTLMTLFGPLWCLTLSFAARVASAESPAFVVFGGRSLPTSSVVSEPWDSTLFSVVRLREPVRDSLVIKEANDHLKESGSSIGRSSSPSVILMQRATVSPLVWKQALTPHFLFSNPRGTDQTVQWKANVSGAAVAAKQLVDVALSGSGTSNQYRNEMCQDIAVSMQSFESFCSRKLPIQSDKNACLAYFSARLVATRGAAGTKCPIWHIDHVPCRWIQALAGPGCLWIENDDAIRWNNWELDLVDSDDKDKIAADISLSNDQRNRLLIDKRIANVAQAPEGVGVILIGNQWIDRTVRPAVHKSPDGLFPVEGRVVLSLNVHTNDYPFIK